MYVLLSAILVNNWDAGDSNVVSFLKSELNNAQGWTKESKYNLLFLQFTK